MKELTKNDICHIAGGSLSEGYAGVYSGFEQKYTNLGYEIGRGWDSYQQAVNKYGSDNVPYQTVPSTTGSQYIIFAIRS